MRTKRTLDPEFKNQAVKLALESNRTVTTIGKELGMVRVCYPVGSRNTNSVRLRDLRPLN